jgi:hypothetical protein
LAGSVHLRPGESLHPDCGSEGIGYPGFRSLGWSGNVAVVLRVNGRRELLNGALVRRFRPGWTISEKPGEEKSEADPTIPGFPGTRSDSSPLDGWRLHQRMSPRSGGRSNPPRTGFRPDMLRWYCRENGLCYRFACDLP